MDRRKQRKERKLKIISFSQQTYAMKELRKVSSSSKHNNSFLKLTEPVKRCKRRKCKISSLKTRFTKKNKGLSFSENYVRKQY
jgi:hypothetical protein